jgi:hypothetical protein
MSDVRESDGLPATANNQLQLKIDEVNMAVILRLIAQRLQPKSLPMRWRERDAPLAEIRRRRGEWRGAIRRKSLTRSPNGGASAARRNGTGRVRPSG